MELGFLSANPVILGMKSPFVQKHAFAGMEGLTTHHGLNEPPLPCRPLLHPLTPSARSRSLPVPQSQRSFRHPYSVGHVPISTDDRLVSCLPLGDTFFLRCGFAVLFLAAFFLLAGLSGSGTVSIFRGDVLFLRRGFAVLLRRSIAAMTTSFGFTLPLRAVLPFTNDAVFTSLNVTGYAAVPCNT